MEMSSTRSVPASVETTWRALNDPQFLQGCVPGCELIEPAGVNEYKVMMAAKIGPVSARFTGRMQLSDLVVPTSYTITFEGQGGAAGFAKGRAHVKLAPEPAGSTAMSYQVDAQVGGKLAQIGARLIDGAARKVADDFFAAFVEKIRQEQGVEAAVVSQPIMDSPVAGSNRLGEWLATHKLALGASFLIVAAALWWLLLASSK